MPREFIDRAHLTIHVFAQDMILRWQCWDYMYVLGVPHTPAKLAICYNILHPSLWLLVPGLSSQFCHTFLYNVLLRSLLVSNIFGKSPQDFVSFGNPCVMFGKEHSPKLHLSSNWSSTNQRMLITAKIAYIPHARFPAGCITKPTCMMTTSIQYIPPTRITTVIFSSWGKVPL